jgi:hypothetical protein
MKENAFLSTNGDPQVTISDYSFNQPSQEWCTHPFCPPYVPRHQPPRSGLFDQINSIWWGPQVMQLLTVQSPAVACHLVQRSPKHLPQHPIVEHPQTMVLSECERPSFIPAQNNRQNYNQVILIYTVYFRICNLHCSSNISGLIKPQWPAAARSYNRNSLIRSPVCRTTGA